MDDSATSLNSRQDIFGVTTGYPRAGERVAEGWRNPGNLIIRLIALLVPLALTVVAGILVSQARDAHDLRVAITRSYERRLLLEQVLSLHQDIETSSRGYALTGREAFLKPLLAAEPRIVPALRTLERTAGAPPEAVHLARLRALSFKKQAHILENVKLCRNGNTAAALARINSGEGLALMDGIRLEIAILQDLEASNLAALSSRSAAAQKRLAVSAFLVLAVLTGLLAVAGLLIARTIRSRAQALDEVRGVSRRRQAILDAAMDGIFILKPSGTIESVNRMGCRMFGYEDGELINRDVGILFASSPPVGQVAANLREMNLRDGEPGELQEISGRCKNGMIISTDVAVSAVSLSEGIHYVAVVRDISERKKIDRMKSEFVASVSHELRTPLTSISGALGLLTGGGAGALPERAERLLQIAHSNAGRLVRLINDILDIEKIDAGGMTFDNQMLCLADIAKQAVEAHQGYAERLGVSFNLDIGAGEARVWADPDRLMQVLANLISNAAKFSPRGGAVEIRIRPGEDEHRISVCDTGPGISPEFATRIFNRFAQADSSDARQKEGTGLGLAIVREIVTRLGGRVSYDSVPGQGAQFHIDLPAAQAVDAPEAADRLLLCEHDPVLSRALVTALSTTGLLCDVAASTTEAKRAAARFPYRVILVASNLPSGGGIGLVHDLRDRLDLAATPILMISAEAERGVVGAEALQIAEWLHKPVPLEAVVSAVKRAVEHVPEGHLPRVLHIEDDPDIVRLVATAFEGKAIITSASSIEQARKVLAKGEQDLAILDLNLSDGSGLELLPDLGTARGGAIPVIIFSAQDADPEVAACVQAFLTKSHTPIERLVRTVIRLARSNRENDK